MSFLEYAPAPESRGILNLRDAYGLFIDGEFVEGTGEGFATISPAATAPSAMSAARPEVSAGFRAGTRKTRHWGMDASGFRDRP